MPGIPIEPDLINESETLNEVSPGTMDTLVDTDAALDLETSGIDEPTMYEEAEVEEVEEDLREMEPPEEDQLSDYDIDTPIVRVVGPESDYDDGDDEDEDDDVDGADKNEDVHEEKESVDEHITDGYNKDIIDGSGRDLNEMLGHRTTIDELTEGEGQTEDVLDRLRVDADSAGDSDTSSNSKRESGEVFHDAMEGQEVGSTADITEDPGGLELDSKVRNSSEGKSDLSEIYESLSKNEINTVNVDTDSKNQTNNNTEADKDSHVMQIQTDIDQSEPEGNIGEIQTDNTVTSLNEPSLCEEV